MNLKFDDSEVIFKPIYVENKIEGFPKVGITLFSETVMNRIIEIYKPEIISYLNNIDGRKPVYKINYDGYEFALYLSRVGAPATIISYEEMMVKGMEKLIIFGTCGTLIDTKDLEILIPEKAYRDEGVSHSYIEDSEYIDVNTKYMDDFINILKEHNYSYKIGNIWTTDCLYRETVNKSNYYKNKGCIGVDMECASINACSKYYNKEIFQFFYSADSLNNSNWDKKSFDCIDQLDEKEKIILLAFELGKKLY